jgi:GH25 family lysozyme M1 (1,4-beta-N-acetylmuramidase)
MNPTLRNIALQSAPLTRTLARLAAPALLSLVATACISPVSSDDGDGDGDNAGTSESGVSACGKTTVRGVDVSKWNGSINWTKVKSSGISFAFIKATQGSGFTDPQFAANWSGAKAAGVIRSAYHFFDPTVSGVTQAQNYLKVVGTLAKGDLAPALDLECPDGNPDCLYSGGSGWAPGSTIRTRVVDFLQTVEQATGKKPIIYTFYSYFTGAGVSTAGLEQYPLWQAMVSPSNGCFSLTGQWSKWTFWQDGWHGVVPGIPGEVDTDFYNGTLAELVAFAGGSSGGGGVPAGASCAQGNGLYCGGHGVSGSSLKLYDCQNGAVTPIETCALGCEPMPDGQNDQCAAGSTCPQGNGQYCGGHDVGGSPGTLYQCTNGTLSKAQSCSAGCASMPAGVNDKCQLRILLRSESPQG